MAKIEMNSERALDEIFFLRDQIKLMQEERKKDVEETAEFIKSLINNNKMDIAKDMQRILGDFDKVRRDLSDRAPITELLDLKSKILSQLDMKVELKEV